MAEEKKDVVVPSAGNEKLQPGVSRSLRPGDTLNGPALNNKDGYQGGGGLRGPAFDPKREGKIGSLGMQLNGPAFDPNRPGQIGSTGLNTARALRAGDTLNGPAGEHVSNVVGAKLVGGSVADKPIPPTAKKSPSSGPPTYHGGVKTSGINGHIKNSSFRRGVPFSGNADYEPMWKNTMRLSSVAIRGGETQSTNLGLYHSPFGLNGFTVQGYSHHGALPLASTQSTIKGMQTTFHIAQDEDA